MSQVFSTAAAHRDVLTTGSRRNLLGIAVITATVCAAYWPALTGKFLWDDDVLLTDNPLIKDPAGLFRIWFTGQAVDYWPVTNSLLWVEWRLFGQEPLSYHLVNLALHICAALLTWLLLARLSIPGAFLAALLWALHPVNVEAVAWISQQKTLLATVFFLLSILCYLKAAPAPHGEPPWRQAFTGRWYWLSLICFVLGMLSKGSIAILPLVLLGLACWQHGRVAAWDVARVVPLLLVAAVLTDVNILFQYHGKTEAIRDVGLVERLLGAATAVWFYLGKALWPLNLAFVYPRWEIKTSSFAWWLPLLAAVALTALLWRHRDRGWARATLFAWAFFCIALTPMLGFTDVGFMKYSLVADHYQYIAIGAVTALAGAAWCRGYSASPALAIFAAALVVIAYMALARQQSAMYKDLEILWRTTIDKNPNCAIAHNRLGQMYLRQGSASEALQHFEQALQLEPDSPELHGYLGMALLKAGRGQEGMRQLRRAVDMDPQVAKSRYDLGTALMQAEQLPEAITQLEEAVRLAPEMAAAHSNLAMALFNSGRQQEAILHFEQTLRLVPEFHQAHSNLGRALFNVGHQETALEHFRQAVQKMPEDADCRNDLGGALLAAGQLQPAIAELREAVRLKPEFPSAHNNLGKALLNARQPQEAIEHLEFWLRTNSDSIAGWSNLATANALAGHRGKAIAAGQKAAELARAQGKSDLAHQLEAWLASLSADAARPAANTAPPTLPPTSP